MSASGDVVKLTTTWRHREPEAFINESVVVVVIMASTSSWTRTRYSKAQRDVWRCIVKTVTDEEDTRSGFCGMALRLFYGFHRPRTRYTIPLIMGGVRPPSSPWLRYSFQRRLESGRVSIDLFVYLYVLTHIWHFVSNDYLVPIHHLIVDFSFLSLLYRPCELHG